MARVLLGPIWADAKTKPVKAKDGKVLVQEKDNEFVAGMGKAYEGDSRKVQIR